MKATNLDGATSTKTPKKKKAGTKSTRRTRVKQQKDTQTPPEPGTIQYLGLLEPERNPSLIIGKFIAEFKPRDGHRETFIVAYTPRDIDAVVKHMESKALNLVVGDYLHLIYIRLGNQYDRVGMHYTKILQQVEGWAPQHKFSYDKVYGLNDDLSILCLKYLGSS